MDQVHDIRQDVTEAHTRAVVATLREVFGLDTVGGVPVETLVRDLYEAMPPATRLLACHEEPFDVAYDLSSRPEEDRMAFFKASEPRYAAILHRIDRDDGQLSASRGP